MKKIYNYDNCTVIVHIPEDAEFQERLQKASKRFMTKVLFERANVNGDSSTCSNFRKK